MAVLPCGRGFKRGGHYLTQVSVPVLGGYIAKRGNHSRIDTAVVLGHVGNLCPFTPDNLTGGSDETQL